MECDRNMIHAQKLNLEFWVEEVNMVVYIKNRCVTKTLDSKTPHETWTRRKPDVSHLRIFYCKTYAHVFDEKRSKLESKSITYVFLGYCEKTKTYRFMCVETKRIIKSRNFVVFERAKEVKGVHDNRPPSKQVEHVVDETLNDDELVKDDNCMVLKERPVEDVEGDESRSNFSFGGRICSTTR
jgi:hypothetical protein